MRGDRAVSGKGSGSGRNRAVVCGLLAAASWMLGLLVLQAPARAESRKIWERDDSVVSKYGDVSVRLEKDSARNAAWGSFYAHALHRETGINATFHGTCGPFVSVRVIASDTRKLDLSAFRSSRSGRDLPIALPLGALRESLESQCEGLEVIRLRFAPGHHTQEDYTWAGTMTRASGWRLHDGLVATEHDAHHRFSIAVRDFFSVAGVQYRGGCDDEPVLVVKPLYANESERALSKDPDITNVTMVARDAALLYQSECPQTESIRFIVDPIPQDYECREEGDCFLVARRNGETWTVDSGQLEPKEYYSPVGDFSDILEVLAAGEHRILDDYRNFFAFFFESFIGIYSDHCRSLIRDPVGRSIQPVERRYDSSGFLISEAEAGPRREIWIERRYADAFDRYFGSWKAWGTMRMLKSMATRNPNQQLGRVWESATHAMSFFTGNYGSLERQVQGSCSDERIQTAYANMLSYADGPNGQPPITGRFSTDKRPWVEPVENGSSAPRMARLLAEREESAKQRKSRAQEAAEAAARTRAAERQQQIRDEIARRNAPRNSPAPRAAPSARPGGSAGSAGASGREAAQQRVMEHMTRMQQLAQDFQQRLREAATAAERQAIQQEFQQAQQAAAKQYQELLMELQTGR